ncbi:dienelactone hydrolase family protein [Nocardia sp. NBC_00565]|uniref:dienelactone hydrolase family protein n=1 Tax=Nocardia sp. NBC_00565 TaxID=2975993 RepID=UPI002E80F3DF|nr:dienelactone hydrolase family protein [Nocardia sp. NBC_00565]WUC00230.1 dienelactone hydrolase family protein [Nocardia sp. NBC_00565]
MTYQIISRQFDLQVDGSPMTGYLARPEGTEPLPAVLVGAELWGLTEDVRRIVDRVAALGYVAVVVDVYHRSGPETAEGLAESAENREHAFELLGELTRDGVEADCRAAIDYAREQGGAAEQTGVLGFSLGGHLAYFAATRLDLAAAAIFYPGWLTTPGTALSRLEPLLAGTDGIAKGDVRLLMFFAELDHVIDAEQRAQIGAGLTAAGVRHELVVYPGAKHAFFFPGREPYDEAAAQDSWQRVSALFAAELG